MFAKFVMYCYSKVWTFSKRFASVSAVVLAIYPTYRVVHHSLGVAKPAASLKVLSRKKSDRLPLGHLASVVQTSNYAPVRLFGESFPVGPQPR